MVTPVPMAEVWRGDILECVHAGDAVVCDETGEIVSTWGNPDQIILPRSSCKMIQALPLIESGAADRFRLTPEHLVLACASHQAAEIHTERVKKWLVNLDLSDDDFRCGPQMPGDREARTSILRAHKAPCRYHNNCSGKHSGFLTVAKHMKAGPEYVEVSHPVQKAVRQAFEDVTGAESPTHAIDGCSAPNFATTVRGLARAMAFFACSSDQGPIRNRAAAKLVQAMVSFPELISGDGRACTGLMRAMDGKVAIKGGAEGAYVAILPELRLGVAIKIRDGARRGAECAIAAILVHLGVLDRNHPAVSDWMTVPQRNWDGLRTGILKPAAGFPA